VCGLFYYCGNYEIVKNHVLPISLNAFFSQDVFKKTILILVFLTNFKKFKEILWPLLMACGNPLIHQFFI